MGLSSAVDWWEEWQLRVLVIVSQCVQWLLFLTALKRKGLISAPFRLLIWLAYLGSDAVAIYALAALFNRHRKEQRDSLGESVLEVVWAPVLLMHLGGQDGITAYNMEDNELWKRHVLTAVSQITVSVYVFWKSWRGGDKKLLQAAIMLFTLGGIRCLEKPYALRSASINSLVSASDTTGQMDGKESHGGHMNLLQEYVKQARALFIKRDASCSTQAQPEGDIEAGHLRDQALVEGDVDANNLTDQAQGEGDNEASRLPDQAQGQDDVEAYCSPDQAQLEGDTEADNLPNQAKGEGDAKASPWSDEAHTEGDSTAVSSEAYHLFRRPGTDQVNKLFVDLASPYHDRLGVIESFLKLDEEKAYNRLQERLSDTFDLLYTKAKMVRPNIEFLRRNFSFGFLFWGLAGYFRMACIILPFAAIALFHKSHREAYNDKDVKVTYTLLSCTAALEYLSYGRSFRFGMFLLPPTASRCSSTVSQCSFMGFFAAKEKYIRYMFIQRWRMPRNSSSRITILVHGHVKRWWVEQIRDVANYTRFNNHRGQWTVQKAGCGEVLRKSLERPFDESVLLWHIATELCFYKRGASPNHACGTTQFDEEISCNAECPTWCTKSVHHVRATGCKEISNYMMYLLSAKPEMLMAGTRRNLFIAAYNKLKVILEDQEQPLLEQPMRLRRFLYRCINLEEEKKQQLQEERSVAERIFAKMDESRDEKGLVRDAWTLAKGLLELDDEKKMWKVIEGVWVEMLCYSASRCRGYLHAKSLGTGGELLTFVWLLWSHMGMETLAERMQMPDAELASAGGNAGAAQAAQVGGLLVNAVSSQVDVIGEDGGSV